MKFPSEDLKNWCREIQNLIDAPRERKTGIGFCACEIEEAILYAPENMQAQLTSALFWSIWIDQVMYFILLDGGVKPYLRKYFPPAENQLYDKFRSLYPFPKLNIHGGAGQVSPGYLLSEQRHFQKPDIKLLSEDRKEFWGEIKNWLKSIQREDIINAMICAFREDVKLRFENKYYFLVDNL